MALPTFVPEPVGASMQRNTIVERVGWNGRGELCCEISCTVIWRLPQYSLGAVGSGLEDTARAREQLARFHPLRRALREPGGEVCMRNVRAFTGGSASP